jgi:hypothetical protein
MLTCTICRRATPYDDVAAPVGADRCICLRCHARRTGAAPRLSQELRRALSDVLADTAHRPHRPPAAPARGAGGGTGPSRHRAARPARGPERGRRVSPAATSMPALLPPLPPGTVRVWLVEFRLPRSARGASRVRRPTTRGRPPRARR